MANKPVTMDLDGKNYDSFKKYWRNQGTMVHSRIDFLIKQDLIAQGVLKDESS